MSRHIFAIYHAGEIRAQIRDKNVIHRLLHVIRVKLDDSIILFNQTEIYQCTILSCERNSIFVKHEACALYAPAKARFFVPLIEKQYLESILFSCGQHGISDIYIVRYKKSNTSWGIHECDWKRAHAILISGCEQARQYRIPKLHAGILSLDDAFAMAPHMCVADQRGISVITHFNKPVCDAFTCGPEAGLTSYERDRFKYAVTFGPVILRSCDIMMHFAMLWTASHRG